MLRSLLKRILPGRILDQLRDARKRQRHKRWERSVERSGDTQLSHGELVRQMTELGIKRGRDLMLHSALSSIGFVEGGADTVIAALREVIGPDATLLMPAYPMKSSMWETMREKTIFVVDSDPSYMGKITEVFRLMTGTLRSAHPTHSCTALGPRAEEYVATHHESKTPCGPRTPFHILMERKGQILCVGTGVARASAHHTVEDLAENYPVAVYLPEPMYKKVTLGSGETIEVEVMVHDPKLSSTRIDSHQGAYDSLLRDMQDSGILKEGRIGRAKSYLFGADDLLTMHLDRLKSGRTIYSA